MTPKSLLSTVVVLFTVFFMWHGISAFPGGWQPIKNTSDPTIVDMAKFAVENNKVTGPLTFLKVVSGETQVVAGSNYRLDIQAKASDGVHEYEAVVWVKPWENFKQISSFKQIKA